MCCNVMCVCVPATMPHEKYYDMGRWEMLEYQRAQQQSKVSAPPARCTHSLSLSRTLTLTHTDTHTLSLTHIHSYTHCTHTHSYLQQSLVLHRQQQSLHRALSSTQTDLGTG